MDASWAQWIVGLAGIYAGVGVLFAITFVAIGVGKIDPDARAASLGFRLLILPGATALWPLLAARWLRGDSEPPETRDDRKKVATLRSWHRRIFLALAVLLPLLVVLALAARREVPTVEELPEIPAIGEVAP